MPLYDYDCAACGRRIEVVHGVHAPGPEHCPNCGGGPLKKAITAPTIHFKGSGWAKKERRAAAKSSTSGEGGSTGSDDAAKEPATTSTGGNGGSDTGGDKAGDKRGDSGPKKSAPATASTSD